MKPFCFCFLALMITYLSLASQIGNIEGNQLSHSNTLKERGTKKPKKSKSQKAKEEKLSKKIPKVQKEINWLDIFFESVFLIVSSIVLVFHQRKSIIQQYRLRSAEKNCYQDNGKVIKDEQNQQNKLVFIKGKTKAQELFEEPIAKIGGNNLLKICQKVQVLEWRKKSRKSGKMREVYYRLQYVNYNIPIDGNKENSPDFWFIDSETYYNQKVRLGPYQLDDQILDQCWGKQRHFTPQNQHLKMFKEHYQTDRKGCIIQNTIYFFPFTEKQQAQNQSFREKTNIELINQVKGTLRINFYLYETGPMYLIAKKSKCQQATVLEAFDMTEFQGVSEQKAMNEKSSSRYVERVKQFFKPWESILVVSEEQITKNELFRGYFYSLSKELLLVQGIASFLLFFMFWSIFEELPLLARFLSFGNLFKSRTQNYEMLLALKVSVLFYIVTFVCMKVRYNCSDSIFSILIATTVLYWLYRSLDISDF